MRVFSGRRRRAAAGPLPTERLPRQARVDATRPLPPPPHTAQQLGVHSFTHVTAPIIEIFTACRTAPVASAVAPMPSEQAAVDNLKGYCFFLDGDLVGVAEMPGEAWIGEPIEGHTHAVAIAVGHRRPVRPAEPGAEWIAGGEQAAADLRTMEIATVVARYLGTLGHAATAHTMAASDIDRHLVAVHAGVLEARGGTLGNPLLRGGYGLAVVTTTFVLRPDRPLAPRTIRQDLRLQLVHAIGWGGTRPGWRRLDGQDRPWHLGRYPMEKVPRVESPTTLIVADEVARSAARHNFFVRARAGDLGPRAMKEVGRFIEKAPHGLASRAMLDRLVPLQDGDTASEAAPGTADPDQNADAVKALGHFLGADMVGVCEAPEYAWYSHRPDGTPIDADHPNAIVFVLDQGFETMEGASGDDWISGAQSMRAYLRASLITCTVAAHLRRLGWSARAHTAAYDEVNHLPLLLRAGIGELSRIGELVLNPFVGPRFKSGVVTTDLPLRSDRPVDFGLQDFCRHCSKCARECPCGAIRYGPATMFNGYEMWKPDVDRCARYRITNMRGSACGRCMKTCPYNVEGVLAERPFQWAAIHLPRTRRFIARLDDWLGRGAINPAKRWWVDVEVVDGIPVAPPKGANVRQLVPGKKPRAEAGYAVFPPELAPPGSGGMAPHPVDRRAGIEAAARAETPAAARCRLGRSR